MLAYKIFAIFALVISTSQASDLSEKDKFIVLRDACLKSAGIVNEQVATARKGVYTQDPALSAYFDCHFKKLGFIDDAGAFHVDQMVQKFPPTADSKKVEAAGSACTKENTREMKDTAYGIYTCFVQKYGPVNFA